MNVQALKEIAPEKVEPASAKVVEPTSTVLIESTHLTIPAGMRAWRLSEPNERPLLDRFIASSPDQTVYHRFPYVNFCRSHGDRLEILGVGTEDAFQFAIPLVGNGNGFFKTGYIGVVFPPAASKSALKNGLETFKEFLLLNRQVGFSILQPALANAYADPDRSTLIDETFCSVEGQVAHIFSRIIKLPAETGAKPVAIESGITEFSDLSFLENDLLKSYQANCRNKVRQAIKHKPKLRCFLNLGADEATWQRVRDVHIKSSTRTNFTIHSLEHFTKMSVAIPESGGTDLLVMASDGASGADLACVNIHVSGSRALYLMGCSNDEGLRQRANQFCLHAAITFCQFLGVSVFEVGRFFADERAQKERQINLYKAQFGGDLVRILNLTTPGRVLPPLHPFRLARGVKRRLNGIFGL